MMVKQLRHERGWSLDKAALETGVSKAMLGQIERGESSPTIATLWKIASGFETSFSSFLEDFSTSNEKPILRSGKLQPLNTIGDQLRIMPLFPFDKNLGFEIFIIELIPKTEHISLAHEKGVVEHVIVVDGVMEVMVNDTWHSLHKGEGLRFNADQPHGYRNRKGKKAEFHNIIYYPRAKK